MKIFSLLSILVLASCTSKSQTTSDIDDIEEYLRNPPSESHKDTILLYQRPVGLLQETTYELDTIIRVAPFTYADKPCLLIAKLRDSKIYEYDLIYTKNLTMVRPVHAFMKALEFSSGLGAQFSSRDYSSRNEFLEIAINLESRYGKPEISTDTSLLWLKRGVSLRSLNYFTTTIISFFSPGGTFDSIHDWEFCAIFQDTTLVKIQLETSKNELLRVVECSDTNMSSDRRTCVAHLKVWGINGSAIFDFDEKNHLTRYAWQGQSTGSKTMIYTFEIISQFIKSSVSNSHPKENTIKDHTMFLHTWSNEDESVYAYYLVPNQRLQIGRAPSEFMKYFK